jgi:hypothetical protein
VTLSTKPRFDKYDPYVGNFRAPLAVDSTTDQANLVIAVGINSSGALVVGAGQTGIVGVIINNVGHDFITGGLVQPPMAGAIADVMKHGEIVNFIGTTVTAGVFSAGAAGVAGTKYYAHADGSVDTTATAGTLIGHTVEADRLIVNIAT